MHERNYAKMRAAETGGSGLGPPEIDIQQAKQQAAQQQQTGTQGAQKAQQAQAAQTPIPAPPAPSGPVGVTTPFPVQAGEPKGGTEQPPVGANPQPEPPPPGAQPGPPEQQT